MRYGKITRQVVQLQTRSIAVVEAPVQLSKHDLAQLDAEAFAALSPEQLQRLSLKLLSDLKLAHERLDQSPRNSSRPPSSQAPWERGAGGDGGVDPQASNASPADTQRSDPAPEVDLDQADPEASEPEADEAKPSRASESAAAPRPGQRPGAPGHGRTQRLAIDQVLEHHPTHCSRCGAAFPDASRRPAVTTPITSSICAPSRPNATRWNSFRFSTATTSATAPAGTPPAPRPATRRAMPTGRSPSANAIWPERGWSR